MSSYIQSQTGHPEIHWENCGFGSFEVKGRQSQEYLRSWKGSQLPGCSPPKLTLTSRLTEAESGLTGLFIRETSRNK